MSLYYDKNWYLSIAILLISDHVLVWALGPILGMYSWALRFRLFYSQNRGSIYFYNGLKAELNETMVHHCPESPLGDIFFSDIVVLHFGDSAIYILCLHKSAALQLATLVCNS